MKLHTVFLAVIINLLFAINANSQDNNQGKEFNPDGWPVPNVETAQQKNKVSKNLGGIEATFELFVTPEDTVFNRVSTNGKVWAYIIDTDGKKPMEYMLVKSNKFGNFDIKAPASAEVSVPDWVKK